MLYEVITDEAKQIHNFYPIGDLRMKHDSLELSVGDCHLTETYMKGYCKVSKEDAKNHPEYMSDAGEMSWDLKIDKQISYEVGYRITSYNVCYTKLLRSF